jgi:hypothetical protein
VVLTVSARAVAEAQEAVLRAVDAMPAPVANLVVAELVDCRSVAAGDVAQELQELGAAR